MSEETATYHMTNRPPVRIKLEEWECIARATAGWHDGQVRYQANRVASGWIHVRRHNDGRVLVAGEVAYSSQFRGEPNEGRTAGILLSAEDATTAGIVAAIHKLDLVDVPHVSSAALKRDAINDLPAEEL